MSQKNNDITFSQYVHSEIKAGYRLENDEETFKDRREKMYRFLKIPVELEKFLCFSFFQCTDSFSFVVSFLPIRVIWALWNFSNRLYNQVVGKTRNWDYLLQPVEKIDLLKTYLILFCACALSYIDTSVVYHRIKTQSVVKLYIFYNMLEIADRLMSSFGQDSLDALFWTASEKKSRKREHFSLFAHVVISTIYVYIHSAIVLFQALTLSVAINAESKGLLTIMVSNNFIEIKGSVFKKFDRANLLQVTCSDARERFHHCILMIIVIMLTMKEYNWREAQLVALLKVCLFIWVVEIFIDWLKHAFITRFNEIPQDAYKDYTLLIASDVIKCKQQNSFSDHTDYAARRMGFIPLPIGAVICRVFFQTLQFRNFFSFVLLLMGYLCILTFRLLNSIVILGKSCSLIAEAQTSLFRSDDKTKAQTWKDAVSSYCDRVQTPRRRTISRDPRDHDIDHEIEEISSRRTSEHNSDNQEFVSLEYLEDSRRILRPNSMVNLTDINDINLEDFNSDNSMALDTDDTDSTICSTGNRTLDTSISDISESDVLPILRKGILVNQPMDVAC